jgi:hypothetical protein
MENCDEITRIMDDNDIPVVKYCKTLPVVSITGSKKTDAPIIEKHGSIESFFFSKVIYQSCEIERYKKKVIALSNMLASANAVIEAYEEICE